MDDNTVFEIDGLSLRLWVTAVKRQFKVTDGENSGRVKSLKMYRDIEGTFYNYTLEIDSLRSNKADYDTFYEMISAPVESHRLTFPYAQRTLTFEAYVTSGEDNLKIEKTPNGRENRWSGLSINFIAMEPQRRP